MGQAKRRKELGLMPEHTIKPRKPKRVRFNPMYGMEGMGGILALMMSIEQRKNRINHRSI